MRVSRIEVSNHSRIRDLKLDIRDHAVIVGANDVGKSSILRAMQLLLGSSTGQLFQNLSLADLTDKTAEMVVEATLVNFSQFEQALFYREIGVSSVDKSETLRVQLTVAKDPDDEQAVTIRRWFPEAGHERGPSRQQLEAFGWCYLPATRGTSASSLEGPNSALRALLTSIKLGADQETLTKLLEEFNGELTRSTPIVKLRQDVATHLSKAMPRSIQQDDLAVRTAADPADDLLGNVSMFFERDDQHIPVTDQSDGVRQLMAMTLFDLAEGAANVMAIDEPELHLHPSSQRTIARLFGSGSNQKILVTHSPYIVQRFEPSQVIAVSPDGVCHQLSEHRLSAVEKVRAHWWSPRLLEALTARFVVIVEGASDRVIVDRAAELMGLSLDRLGAVIFDIDGAEKFQHVYKLLGKDGFCVSILGLVDEAEKASWRGQIGGKPKDVFGTTLWASNPDLEAEYCTALTGPGTARALIAAGFCREASVLASCEAGSIDEITVDKVAAYCGKNKVDAAVAVASQLDERTVLEIKSVYGLLGRLRALGEK